jgi:hypothetical protein
MPGRSSWKRPRGRAKARLYKEKEPAGMPALQKKKPRPSRGAPLIATIIQIHKEPVKDENRSSRYTGACSYVKRCAGQEGEERFLDYAGQPFRGREGRKTKSACSARNDNAVGQAGQKIEGASAVKPLRPLSIEPRSF